MSRRFSTTVLVLGFLVFLAWWSQLPGDGDGVPTIAPTLGEVRPMDLTITAAYEGEPTLAGATRTPLPTFAGTDTPSPSPTIIPGATGEPVWYDMEETWYSQGATFRSCPVLSAECEMGRVLVSGQPVTVLGEVQGETWQGSRTWYYVEVEGLYGFVHGALITRTSERPTWTPPPTAIPIVPDNSGSSGGGGGFVCPRNCDEAVRMGLTAQQAGTCPRLDRDNDGVACYGD